ncbi:MAG: hypothetical protein JWO80_2511 [Bryobacterales bacterium]|nr:hypothetical protein [Bryobacterales bacterium]
MTTLQEAAQSVTESLRLGDVDEAERQMAELRRLMPSCSVPDDMRAAAATMLEARKLAIVHRAHTMQALQSLIRYRHFAPEGSGDHSFEMEA